MREKIIAKRYAQAYADYAAPVIGMERCVDVMKGLRWLLRDNTDFSDFLLAPEIPAQDKARVLETVLRDHYSEPTRTFIVYLVSKHRIAYLADIADEVRVRYAHGESADVVLRTTFPLELDIIEAIKQRLQVRLGKPVNLYLELDPDLLGGVQINIGHRVLDGSVRGRLEALKKKLLQTQVEQ